MACSAYTCLDVCKNHLLIFSSFLDIWENVEWSRFLDHPVYFKHCLKAKRVDLLQNTCSVTASLRTTRYDYWGLQCLQRVK